MEDDLFKFPDKILFHPCYLNKIDLVELGIRTAGQETVELAQGDV